jgi:hypothetical protein
LSTQEGNVNWPFYPDTFIRSFIVAKQELMAPVCLAAHTVSADPRCSDLGSKITLTESMTWGMELTLPIYSSLRTSSGGEST